MGTPQSSPESTRKGMTFGEAMLAITEQKIVRRLEWPNNGTYVTLVNGQVHIFIPADNKLHPLTINDGDILGTDWIIINVN